MIWSKVRIKPFENVRLVVEPVIPVGDFGRIPCALAGGVCQKDSNVPCNTLLVSDNSQDQQAAIAAEIPCMNLSDFLELDPRDLVGVYPENS